MESSADNLLKFIIELAKEAGDLISKYRTEGNLKTECKTPRDLVTKADLECERLIAARIHERYPEDMILAEEAYSKVNYKHNQEGRLWVIDPIDGTSNFARGHSHACVSIGVCSNSQIEAGVVYSPFQNELFSAKRGGGAFLNGSPIKVSTVDNLQGSLVVTGRPKELKDTPEYLAMLSSIIHACHDFRRIGSAALDICWVACGRVDAFFESLHPWDITAACLIAKEAGAVRSHFREPPADFPLPRELYSLDLLIAAPGISGGLHRMLIESIQ